jgi:hypothetical protein
MNNDIDQKEAITPISFIPVVDTYRKEAMERPRATISVPETKKNAPVQSPYDFFRKIMRENPDMLKRAKDAFEALGMSNENSSYEENEMTKFTWVIIGIVVFVIIIIVVVAVVMGTQNKKRLQPGQLQMEEFTNDWSVPVTTSATQSSLMSYPSPQRTL